MFSLLQSGNQEIGKEGQNALLYRNESKRFTNSPNCLRDPSCPINIEAAPHQTPVACHVFISTPPFSKSTSRECCCTETFDSLGLFFIRCKPYEVGITKHLIRFSDWLRGRWGENRICCCVLGLREKSLNFRFFTFFLECVKLRWRTDM
ncbi:hypothetical protein AVEN_145495-1 [Araneus ventricosus]|uniref:Uncharacterized protein n=1 Tax=Araneus ventricosus TaxID=182803 RepID=A0A4Y2JI98_ARAVE|nr:hypothetical protein AVEN_145495-1 [Araneus ventricosus]